MYDEESPVSAWTRAEKVAAFRVYLGVLQVTRQNGDDKNRQKYLQHLVELKSMLGLSSEDSMALSIEYSIALSLDVMTALGEPENLQRVLINLGYDVSALNEAPT
jgi:hypothetical protein